MTKKKTKTKKIRRKKHGLYGPGRFTWLKGHDECTYPKDNKCPICGILMDEGFAYISSGAVVDYDKSKCRMQDLEGYFSIGYHGKMSDLSDCGDVNIVDFLIGGQFDINFCSSNCLLQWFVRVLSEIRKQCKKKVKQTSIPARYGRARKTVIRRLRHEAREGGK